MWTIAGAPVEIGIRALPVPVKVRGANGRAIVVTGCAAHHAFAVASFDGFAAAERARAACLAPGVRE
jgi:hypothetical protein